MWRQIIAGSVVLVTTTGAHVGVIAYAISLLGSIGEDAALRHPFIFAVCLAAILVGHTAQVWIWAIALRVIGAISNLQDAVYFSLVTTTTLGYGDITLGREWRLFAAMAAVSGLLTFGLSTAFFVGAFARSITL